MTEGVGDDRLKIFFISSSSALATEIAAAVENLSDAGYHVDQWTEERSPGTVTRKIFERTHQADVVVADLSSDNPNVFYELGIAHCLGRPTILFKLKDKPLPFDVYGERAIEVAPNEDGSVRNPNALKTDLNKALSEVKNNPGITGTAIQEYLHKLQERPHVPDGWRAIAAAGESNLLLPKDAKLGTWIYDAVHGLGEIIDVSDGKSNRKRLRIQFADASERELYFTEEARLFIAPPHVQAMLRSR